ncbi:MAG: hypothetical protein DRP83_00810 [Planctomycetota bacterium]|nr:MAG: hypothetical protein DRP83_00810 [Planctomycetota bacterium]
MRTMQNNIRQSLAWVILLTGTLFVSPAWTDSDHDYSGGETPQVQQAQSLCPVMVGNKIDPDLYTVYRGEKVFFCCQFCKTEFEKNPEKYLHRLPQFAAGAATDQDEYEHAEHDHADVHILLAQLAKPTGIATLSLVALTACLGLLRRLRRPSLKVPLQLHKIAGICALGSGAIHAAIVLLTH